MVHGFMVTEMVLTSRKSWWKPYIQEGDAVGVFMFHSSIIYLSIWPLFVIRCGRELGFSWHVLGWLEVYLNEQITVGGKVGLFGTGFGYSLGFLLMIGLLLVGVCLIVLTNSICPLVRFWFGILWVTGGKWRSGLGYGGDVYKTHVRDWRFGMSLQDRCWRLKWQAREWGLTIYGFFYS